MRILFYGNCQTFALMKIMNIQPPHIVKNIECFSTNMTKPEFNMVIKNCDVIISQLISNNYRDLEYLSTEYIIQHCDSNCKIIMFDSCYFNFYYFDLTYKTVSNKLIRKPSDYHYNGLIEYYTNGLSCEQYIKNVVNNSVFKTPSELDEIASNSIFELRRRFNLMNEDYLKNKNIQVISCVDYIQNNFKDKLLFYSMNHPTKYVIQNIAEQILVILNIPNSMLYDLDILDQTKCIIYKCIQNVVNFNIDECKSKTHHFNNSTDIVKLYYDTYTSNKITF